LIQLLTSSTSLFGHLTQFRTRLRSSGLSSKLPLEEPPLRSELFSADQMERHGKTSRLRIDSRRVGHGPTACRVWPRMKAC
jgi:hypothetical protein